MKGDWSIIKSSIAVSQLIKMCQLKAVRGMHSFAKTMSRPELKEGISELTDIVDALFLVEINIADDDTVLRSKSVFLSLLFKCKMFFKSLPTTCFLSTVIP